MHDKIKVQNINTPDVSTRVDGAKYNAMRDATLRVMTTVPPGHTAKDIKDAAKPHLPAHLFPAGATAGWLQKCVQLDLEAKGIIKRSPTKPQRFYLA